MELCKLLLPDSGHLQEEDAEYANRRGFSKHHPASPLYTEEEAKRSLRQFHAVGHDIPIDLCGGLSAQFAPSGHILGSAFVTLTDGSRRLVFSGDLGRPNDPIMRAARPLETADELLNESTYGDRRHEQIDPADEFESIITRTIRRGGIVVIPAFAVGRAQSLLYYIAQLKATARVPSDLPVYLNSPMAIDVTGLYERFMNEHRLDKMACAAMCHAAKYVNTVDESKHLNTLKMPMIIVAASGMATGGRVVHHLKAFAPNARNTILLSGYQAAGTRGATMLGGVKTIRIHGADVPVRAEVASISTLSAHADYAETLQWLGHFNSPPQTTYITHSEPLAADALRQHIERVLHWKTHVPDDRECVDLDEGCHAQR